MKKVTIYIETVENNGRSWDVMYLDCGNGIKLPINTNDYTLRKQLSMVAVPVPSESVKR